LFIVNQIQMVGHELVEQFEYVHPVVLLDRFSYA